MLAALLLIQAATGVAEQVESDKPVLLASLPSPDMSALKEAVQDCVQASADRRTVASMLQQIGWRRAKVKSWGQFSPPPGKLFTNGAGSAVIYLDRSSPNSPPCSVTGVIETTPLRSVANTVAAAVSAKNIDILLGSMMFPGTDAWAGMRVTSVGPLVNYRVSVLFLKQEKQ